MGIRFVIGRDCSAKQAMAVEELVWRVQKAQEIEIIGTQWQASDPTLTNEQIIIDWTETAPDGTEQTVQKSIAELKMEYGDLQRYLAECQKCKANVASDRFSGGVCSGYGCLFTLYPPIPKEFEEALIAGAKAAVANAKVVPAIEFLNKIVKNKLTGEWVKGLRGGEDPLLESKSALEFTYGGFMSKKTVDTNQMLQLLLTQTVAPDDSLLFHMFLEHSVIGIKQGRIATAELLTQVETLSATFAAAGDMRATIHISM
jgi:hypothetical protein